VKDAVKGINMFRKVQVPILGLLQNMSAFKCPCCNTSTHVFGSTDSVQRVCREHGMDLLGDIPLDPNIGEDTHKGKPTVISEPDSERAMEFLNIAETIGRKIGL